jgi:hypothetical protein
MNVDYFELLRKNDVPWDEPPAGFDISKPKKRSLNCNHPSSQFSASSRYWTDKSKTRPILKKSVYGLILKANVVASFGKAERRRIASNSQRARKTSLCLHSCNHIGITLRWKLGPDGNMDEPLLLLRISPTIPRSSILLILLIPSKDLSPPNSVNLENLVIP